MNYFLSIFCFKLFAIFETPNSYQIINFIHFFPVLIFISIAQLLHNIDKSIHFAIIALEHIINLLVLFDFELCLEVIL